MDTANDHTTYQVIGSFFIYDNYAKPWKLSMFTAVFNVYPIANWYCLPRYPPPCSIDVVNLAAGCAN